VILQHVELHFSALFGHDRRSVYNLVNLSLFDLLKHSNKTCCNKLQSDKHVTLFL
jgi:hypothetical protein